MYKKVVYTPVNGTVTHLKLQKSQKDEYSQYIDIEAMCASVVSTLL